MPWPVALRPYLSSTDYGQLQLPVSDRSQDATVRAKTVNREWRKSNTRVHCWVAYCYRWPALYSRVPCGEPYKIYTTIICLGNKRRKYLCKVSLPCQSRETPQTLTPLHFQIAYLSAEWVLGISVASFRGAPGQEARAGLEVKWCQAVPVQSRSKSPQQWLEAEVGLEGDEIMLKRCDQ